jgi:hypothetical protein
MDWKWGAISNPQNDAFIIRLGLIIDNGDLNKPP